MIEASQSPDAEADSQVGYRRIDPWAQGGLLVGGLSLLALVGGAVTWLIPLFGVVVNLISIRRIARETSLAGRNVALAGLGLSIMFLIAAPARHLAAQVLLARSARHT